MAETPDVELDRLIGSNVRRYRTAKGLSQADLAAALSEGGEHVHQQTVQKVEKGVRPLKFAEALKLARVLGVDVIELSLGERWAAFNAEQLSKIATVDRMRSELDDFGSRLAELLLDLAVGVSIESDGPGKQPNPNPEAKAIAKKVKDQLKVNWGKLLNIQILQELRHKGYISSVRPEYDASTYAGVLKRVAESDITYPKFDESEA